MDITINELEQLSTDSYTLLDMRGDVEVGHGIIPGAIHMSQEDILEKYSGGLIKLDEAEAQEREGLTGKKLIIYCARGRISQELAEELRDRGYDAYSLKGGYTSWLLNQMKNQQADEVCAQVEKSIRKKFRKNIWCKFTKAINQYELVKEGDCIAVCISGGKDSMLMAKLFQELKLHNKFPFEVKFIVMDPGYSPENRKVIEENARKLKISIHIFESDIFESVYHIEKSPCYLCARMRRGYLYNFAKELGCNKIALGHHYDDVIETILMGMLYGAQIQTMMPKLHSTNFEGMELIRPLYLIREDDIKAWRDYNDLRFIQCACKFTDTCTTCNNEENQSKRVEIKQLIAEIKKKNPYVEAHIFKSVENVNIETVIAYKKDGVKHHFLDNYDLNQ
nr:ATP-binding protein [uncultured Anaerobutyricum sp.]